MSRPVLYHVLNLWSLVEYPSKDNEWSLEQKLRAIKAAGFDGFLTHLRPEDRRLTKKVGLCPIGYFSGSNASEFPAKLHQQARAGARVINVQLADHDTLVEDATTLAVLLIQESKRQGLDVSIEVHRDTCTETPEKTYAIADAYRRVTGELMPITWDFSHLAVVKHLWPDNFSSRLLTRPDLIQRANQLHLRPFNGHHCQVPVTDGHGQLSEEFKAWLPFATDLLGIWLDGNRNSGRTLYVVPELGPASGGYNFSMLPNSWEDAQVLRREIDRLWQELLTRKSSKRKRRA